MEELESYLTDIADAIREAEGSTDEIPASSFSTRISNLSSSGGGGDKLTGKKILFVGDSICQGVNTNEQPYAYWIAQNHPSATVVNLGQGGMTIANRTDNNNMFYKINNNDYASDIEDADIIVIEGGINDIGNNIKLGYIKQGFRGFDVNTTCGGLEYALKYFTENKKPTTKVYVMSTYNCKNYNQHKQLSWWRAFSEIASKWGAEFIDVYSAIPTALLTGAYETELHAPMVVHRDLITPIVDNALCYGNCYAARTTIHYSFVPMEIYFHSGTATFNVGDTFSTSDWRINSIDTNGVYSNVTSLCTFDSSEVDMSIAGTYRVFFHCNDKGISLGGFKDITVEAGGSDDGGADGGDSDTGTWQDETTITRTWATSEGVFNNLSIDTNSYSAGTTVNVNCKLLVEGTPSSGEIILRIAGATYNAGTINFNQEVEISGTMNANASWAQTQKLSVYTTNGSNFPWTVKVKDFSLSV